MPISYRGITIDAGYRMDLLIEDTVVVELKAVARLMPIHSAQLLSYLRLSTRPVGLLLNFHVPAVKHGIIRLVNNGQKPSSADA